MGDMAEHLAQLRVQIAECELINKRFGIILNVFRAWP
jgi:hypothetical protein